MPADLTAARAQAWRTRRKKYGPRGHRGSYSRSSAPCRHCRGAIDMLIKLYAEGTLSEGQVATATRLDRVTIRRMTDELTRPETVEGNAL